MSYNLKTNIYIYIKHVPSLNGMSILFFHTVPFQLNQDTVREVHTSLVARPFTWSCWRAVSVLTCCLSFPRDTLRNVPMPASVSSADVEDEASGEGALCVCVCVCVWSHIPLAPRLKECHLICLSSSNDRASGEAGKGRSPIRHYSLWWQFVSKLISNPVFHKQITFSDCWCNVQG